MADKPIQFSGPMIRAILEGRKTQTRRVLKPKRGKTLADFTVDAGPALGGIGRRLELPVDDLAVPYAPGDRLWVREAITASGALIQYVADGKTSNEVWPSHWQRYTAPAMHMPRVASRITLTVTDVRIERLQAISAADSIAEGVECETCAAMKASACGGKGCFASVAAYRTLWNSINGPGAWADNPWVAAYTFTVEHRNIDAGDRS